MLYSCTTNKTSPRSAGNTPRTLTTSPCIGGARQMVESYFTTVPCTHCQTIIRRRTIFVARRERPFCSRTCYYAYRREHPRTKVQLVEIPCTYCGVVCRRERSRLKKSGLCFCSNRCRGLYGRKTLLARAPSVVNSWQDDFWAQVRSVA